jgi:hypothetical protein
VNSTIKKFMLYFLTIAVLMLSTVLLVACSSAGTESTPTATNELETDVFVPIVESDVSESDELVSGEMSDPYPASEQEIENQEVEVVPQETAYPEPESDDVSDAIDENTQVEANPAPQEEPVQEIRPTPRGNELAASDPSTVNLASGGLQLVELFAFW